MRLYPFDTLPLSTAHVCFPCSTSHFTPSMFHFPLYTFHVPLCAFQHHLFLPLSTFHFSPSFSNSEFPCSFNFHSCEEISIVRMYPFDSAFFLRISIVRMCPFDTRRVHEVIREISIVRMYPFDTLPRSTFHFRVSLYTFHVPLSTCHFPISLFPSTFHIPLDFSLSFSSFHFRFSFHFN